MGRWLHRMMREPLVHFLIIGAGLFLAFGLTRGPTPDPAKRIVVDAAQVAQLSAQFSRIWMRPPSAEELAGLINSYIRDEVYYREALAMGLDRNDPLVRRRLRQKLEFILEDFSAAGEADEQTLQRFLDNHADLFRLEPQVSFRQIYLNPENQGDTERRAERILAELETGSKPETLGDPTLMARNFELAPLSYITRSFGAAFAQSLLELPPGTWSGPIYSSLGGHLVAVAELRQARLPQLAEIRARVEREYLARQRRDLMEKAYQQLRKDYQVIVEAAGANALSAALAAENPEELRR